MNMKFSVVRDLVTKDYFLINDKDSIIELIMSKLDNTKFNFINGMISKALVNSCKITSNWHWVKFD